MRRLILLGAIGALAACSDPSQPQGQAQQSQKAPDAAKVAPGANQAPVVPANPAPALALNTTQPGADAVPAPAGASVGQAAAEPAATVPAATAEGGAQPLVQAINQAGPPAAGKPAAAAAAVPAGWTVKGVDPALIKAEVLLDRAGFSPGVIDGKDGQNLKQALAAYAQAKGVQGGALDKGVWDSLASDTAPVAQTYVVTDADAAGPFIGEPPKDYEAMSKLPAMSFSTPLQALAEKFHMDQGLLKALNPGADFGKAGTSLIVAVPHMTPRTFTVARIEVDKSDEAVRAYDAAGKLVAYYPATVGSTERPAPTGAFKVIAVAPHPVYFYDPKRLTFTPQGAKGKLKIQAGPNNPVGETWIALNIPTYGIHGAPDPAAIGKRQSHGCVRLTNWDAVELGKAVKKGAKVDFVGTEKKA
jgi:lipoprotein-anchoring transpeptidase ErfK/SrfK